MNTNVLIYREDGKRIGSVKNKVFTKNLKKSKHFFRKAGGGIGLDVDIVNQLKDLEVETIQIKETEEDKIYSASLTSFIENSREINFGWGIQKLLPLHYWKIEEK